MVGRVVNTRAVEVKDAVVVADVVVDVELTVGPGAITPTDLGKQAGALEAIVLGGLREGHFQWTG